MVSDYDCGGIVCGAVYRYGYIGERVVMKINMGLSNIYIKNKYIKNNKLYCRCETLAYLRKRQYNNDMITKED